MCSLVRVFSFLFRSVILSNIRVYSLYSVNKRFLVVMVVVFGWSLVFVFRVESNIWKVFRQYFLQKKVCVCLWMKSGFDITITSCVCVCVVVLFWCVFVYVCVCDVYMCVSNVSKGHVKKCKFELILCLVMPLVT